MPNLIGKIAARIASLETALATITRHSERRESFMDHIDWHAMTQEDCRIASMADEHIETRLFDIHCELASNCSSYDAMQREWMAC